MARNLIGTGADQVSVNGMLGELAFQTKENVNFTGGTGKLSKLDIDAISAQLGVTAVDVFVYDTRKDSDGGAWRKRCRHLSWYNETLNTSTRGSRKEFPSVAVIVATTTSVIIYDGDDPTIPLWMAFNMPGIATGNNLANTGYGIYSYSGYSFSITSVYMLNSRLVIGLNGGSGTLEWGIWDIEFLKDYGTCHLSYPSGGWQAGVFPSLGNLSQRNSTSFETQSSKYSANKVGIAYSLVNDVTMSILPNSTIDGVTGLAVPHVAVASNYGTAVIKSDGTISAFPAYYAWPHSSVSSYGEYFSSTWSDGVAAFGTAFHKLSESPSGTLEQTGPVIGGYPAISNYWHNPFGNMYSGTLRNIMISNTESCSYVNGSSIKNGIYKHALDPFATKQSMTARIGYNHNTGWMHGDTKGAWLCDTTQETAIGSELVTNGTFNTDTSGWTLAGNGTATVSSGVLSLAKNGAVDVTLKQTINTVIGKTYTFSVSVLTAQNNYALSINNSNESVTHAATGYVATTGTTILSFVATTSTSVIVLQQGGSVGAVSTFDNVSVRLGDTDRSSSNKGLQVFGSITKTPVSTGADLVAYSGFSSGNYLEQPYNSALDFGASDFCIMGWIRTNGNVSTPQCLLSLGEIDGTLDGFVVEIGADDAMYAGYLATNPFTPAQSVSAGWTFIAVYRRSGVLYLQLNGTSTTSVGDTTNLTTRWTTRKLVIGSRVTGANYCDQTVLTLWRISATVPSPEQIAKIYNDEKVLFQDNAKATLYGTSDGVTALGYDEDTQLLHVGTSAGRSVFQGLRRIDNTTTAVSASISASNGLVAEQ